MKLMPIYSRMQPVNHCPGKSNLHMLSYTIPRPGHQQNGNTWEHTPLTRNILHPHNTAVHAQSTATT